MNCLSFLLLRIMGSTLGQIQAAERRVRLRKSTQRQSHASYSTYPLEEVIEVALNNWGSTG